MNFPVSNNAAATAQLNILNVCVSVATKEKNKGEVSAFSTHRTLSPSLSHFASVVVAASGSGGGLSAGGRGCRVYADAALHSVLFPLTFANLETKAVCV